MRSVFILTLPSSAEMFWQAAGRAGRIGLFSYVYIFSSFLHTFIEFKEAMPEDLPSLRVVARTFHGGSSCLTGPVVAHIEGFSSVRPCGRCALCRGSTLIGDVALGVSQLLLSLTKTENRDLNSALRRHGRESHIITALTRGLIFVCPMGIATPASTDDEYFLRHFQVPDLPLFEHAQTGPFFCVLDKEAKKGNKRGGVVAEKVEEADEGSLQADLNERL